MKYLTLLFTFLTSFAYAHPHIWIDSSAWLVGSATQVERVKAKWTFDELYSATFILEADVNKDKVVDAAELQIVVDEVFGGGQEDLKAFFLFQFGGKNAPFAFENAKAYVRDDLLIYEFDAVFEEPQSLVGEHKIAFYDPEFYVAFEQDLELNLPEGAACKQLLAEDKEISIYMGFINPETYKLTCEVAAE